MIKIKIQLTNGYYLHFNQLTRIIQFSSTRKVERLIPRQDFLIELGMSERQFENLSSIAVGLGLMKPRTFVLTPIGYFIAQFDLYFEKLETLWLLHYIISSEQKWVVWNRLVNQCFHELDAITTERAISYFTDLQESISEKTYKSKLPKEILSVLNAYSESDFSKLNFLKKGSIGQFEISEPIMVDHYSLLYSLLAFRNRYFPNATSLELGSIMKNENSPGRVFFLHDYQFSQLLNKLHDLNLVRIETFGDLEQIRFSQEVSKDYVLNKIYGEL